MNQYKFYVDLLTMKNYHTQKQRAAVFVLMKVVVKYLLYSRVKISTQMVYAYNVI